MTPQALLQDQSYAPRIKHEGHVLHIAPSLKDYQLDLPRSFKTLLCGLININLVEYFFSVAEKHEITQ